MSGIRILVLQRGWVVIGRVAEQGQYLIITDGYVIRRWGTTKGLGQLAAEGKQAQTILDPSPPMRTHALLVINEFSVTHPSWEKVCGDDHPLRTSDTKPRRAAR